MDLTQLAEFTIIMMDRWFSLIKLEFGYIKVFLKTADAALKKTEEILTPAAAGDSGTLDFQGSTISWVKTGTSVTLTVTEANGSRTEITVPIGSFAF